MSKKAKEETKKLRKKVKDQGAWSRNRKDGGNYTRPLLLVDFAIQKEGAE